MATIGRCGWVVATLVAACFVATLTGVAGQAVKYNSGPGNINGKVLILDVTSLRFQGNHPVFPSYSNPEQCETACKSMAGCNAWTFCNSKSGCGSGCREYVKKNPQLKYYSGNPTQIDPAWKVPVLSLGPWGHTSNCMTNYTGQGSVQLDQWPLGMCSLKMVANPAAPAYWSKDPKEGWVSGTIATPSTCAGASAAVCQGCLATKDPAGCLACAKSPQVTPANKVAVAGQFPFAGVGCVRCYNTSVNPARCADCMIKGGNCKPCPLDTWAAGDVDQCIACANKYDARSYTGCATCATQRTSKAVTQCMACFDQARKVACRPGVYAYNSNFTCADLDQAAGQCGTCGSQAADFAACAKCVVTKPYSSGCDSCAILPNAAQQSACYTCRATSGVTNSACSDCQTYVKDPAQKAFCLSCLADPKISGEGKSWCFGCSKWYPNQAGWTKCQKCLATKSSDYTSVCSRLA